MLAASLPVCLAAAAAAQPTDGVASHGLLADSDFFRQVTCAAPPGEACRTPILRWKTRDLSLAIRVGTDPRPENFDLRLRAAVDRALRQVNTAGAAIRITRTEGPDADIAVLPTAIPEGTRMTDVPDFSAPGIMGAGYMTVWADTDHHITRAVILISTTISDEDLASIVLEEITQSLGPRFDIENPAYEGLSILSQTSNSTTTLTGQDARLLRWLYPSP